MNICAECRHSLTDGPTLNVHAWYCKAMGENPKDSQCPITGEWGHRKTNDIGGTYLDTSLFPKCKDLNQEGTCQLWEGHD